jgi:hypothetical protein
MEWYPPLERLGTPPLPSRYFFTYCTFVDGAYDRSAVMVPRFHANSFSLVTRMLVCASLLASACAQRPEDSLLTAPQSKEELNANGKITGETDTTYYAMKVGNVGLFLQAAFSDASREPDVSGRLPKNMKQIGLPKCLRRLQVDRYQWENCDAGAHRIIGQHQVKRRTDGTVEQIVAELVFSPRDSKAKGYVWSIQWNDIVYTRRVLQDGTLGANQAIGNLVMAQYRNSSSPENIFQAMKVDGLSLEYDQEEVVAMDFNKVQIRETPAPVETPVASASNPFQTAPATNPLKEIKIVFYTSDRMVTDPTTGLPEGEFPYAYQGRDRSFQGRIESDGTVFRETNQGALLVWPCQGLCFMH